MFWEDFLFIFVRFTRELSVLIPQPVVMRLFDVWCREYTKERFSCFHARSFSELGIGKKNHVSRLQSPSHSRRKHAKWPQKNFHVSKAWCLMSPVDNFQSIFYLIHQPHFRANERGNSIQMIRVWLNERRCCRLLLLWKEFSDEKQTVSDDEEEPSQLRE